MTGNLQPQPLKETARLELLVLQPTPFCNINCSYCYLPDRDSRRTMTEQTVEKLFVDLFGSSLIREEMTIAWHAGEPLVAGIGYYQRMFAVIARLNRRNIAIRHNFQTNGILLNQQWIDFCRAHGVQLGLSVDGPQELHDAHRKTRRGTGTFAQVMKAIRLLQDNQFPFHVIGVLTKASLTAADEIFDFFVGAGITHVGFNVEEVEAANTSSSLQSARDAEIREFYQALLRRVEREPGKLEVREFVNAREIILHRELSNAGNAQAEPLRILSVGVDGQLSTFSPELLGASYDAYEDFVFGNVHDGGLAGLSRNPCFQAAARDIRAGVELCRKNCEYFDVCQGGAPANKLFENGTFASDETAYCRFTKKIVIDVVLSSLERELAA